MLTDTQQAHLRALQAMLKMDQAALEKSTCVYDIEWREAVLAQLKQTIIRMYGEQHLA